MVSVSTWTSPEIDARIVELKQKGVSHTQIAAVIVAEFRVFVNKNMVLRRARTILGIDRGEKAANDRLERKRKAEKAERAARMPKEPAPRPVNIPAPVVTLPPLASVAGPTGGYGPLAFNYQSLMPPRPATPLVAAPAPLGNGKCTFPKWENGAPISHEYCNERTPLGSSWCAQCRAIVYHRVRAA
jgi:hypothetical protein